MRVGKLALELFHERLFEVGEEGENAVYRRSVGNGIAGVDDGLSGKVGRACKVQSFGCSFAGDSKDDEFAELRGVGEVADGRRRIFRTPVSEFVQSSGAHLHLMTMGE